MTRRPGRNSTSGSNVKADVESNVNLLKEAVKSQNIPDIERYSEALNKAFEAMYQQSQQAQGPQGGPQGPFGGQGGPQGGPQNGPDQGPDEQ